MGCCGGEKCLSLRVSSMSCNHCKQAIEKALAGLEGVSEVSVDLAAKTVKVCMHPLNEGQIREVLAEAGYQAD